MVAANRFVMPGDFGCTDASFAAGGAVPGINGGGGSVAARYFFRRWKFSTGSWAAKAGRFLWQNSLLSPYGVIDGGFSFTIQKAQIRSLAGDLVGTLAWGGASNKLMAPGAIAWSDPAADLAALTTYYLDLWWTAPDHGAFPIAAPQYLAGETTAARLSPDLALDPPSTTQTPVATAGGAAYGPTLFAARGWDGIAPAVLLLGDSIVDFANVAAKLAPPRGDIGHLQQALGDTTGGTATYVSAARYSSSFTALYGNDLGGFAGRNLIDWFADACSLVQPAPMFNRVICNHGRNAIADISLAAMQTFLTTAVAKLQSRYSGIPWFQTTTTPFSYADGLTSWTTSAQTPVGAQNSAGGLLQQWNDWILAGAGGLIAGGIDTAAACRDAGNYGKWKTAAWSTTTLDAIAAGTSNVLRLAAAPQIGDTLAIEDDKFGSYHDLGQRCMTVCDVQPHASGGYAVTLTSGSRLSWADLPAAAYNAWPTKAHNAGARVYLQFSRDGLHPSHAVQMQMRDIVIAAKPAIAAAIGPA